MGAAPARSWGRQLHADDGFGQANDVVNEALDAAARARPGTGPEAWAVTWPATLVPSRATDDRRPAKNGCDGVEQGRQRGDPTATAVG